MENREIADAINQLNNNLQFSLKKIVDELEDIKKTIIRIN